MTNERRVSSAMNGYRLGVVGLRCKTLTVTTTDCRAALAMTGVTRAIVVGTTNYQVVPPRNDIESKEVKLYYTSAPLIAKFSIFVL